MSQTLNAPVFHILLALSEGPLHGLGIADRVEAATEGAVDLGPGTLYRSLKEMTERMAKLEAQAKAAEALPEKVTIAGKAEPAGARAETIQAKLTPGDAGPTLALHFGMRIATFTIDPKAFQKAD